MRVLDLALPVAEPVALTEPVAPQGRVRPGRALLGGRGVGRPEREARGALLLRHEPGRRVAPERRLRRVGRVGRARDGRLPRAQDLRRGRGHLQRRRRPALHRRRAARRLHPRHGLRPRRSVGLVERCTGVAVAIPSAIPSAVPEPGAVARARAAVSDRAVRGQRQLRRPRRAEPAVRRRRRPSVGGRPHEPPLPRRHAGDARAGRRHLPRSARRVVRRQGRQGGAPRRADRLRRRRLVLPHPAPGRVGARGRLPRLQLCALLHPRRGRARHGRPLPRLGHGGHVRLVGPRPLASGLRRHAALLLRLGPGGARRGGQPVRLPPLDRAVAARLVPRRQRGPSARLAALRL
mmetsp:Transcript_25787/g.76767  ORF Transcript_25787/g.76767 Transcript_25787/m.76767 type:complete len:349 (-) Transcript_25787:1289-2335(-)